RSVREEGRRGRSRFARALQACSAGRTLFIAPPARCGAGTRLGAGGVDALYVRTRARRSHRGGRLSPDAGSPRRRLPVPRHLLQAIRSGGKRRTWGAEGGPCFVG